MLLAYARNLRHVRWVNSSEQKPEEQLLSFQHGLAAVVPSFLLLNLHLVSAAFCACACETDAGAAKSAADQPPAGERSRGNRGLMIESKDANSY